MLSPSDTPNLRYHLMDGTTGKLFPTADGAYEGGEGWGARSPVTLRTRLPACGAPGLSLQWRGEALQAERIALPTRPITFASGPERLYGELVLPPEGRPKAVVVLQYGSDRESAVLNNFVQHLLPLKGIAVFVFDKRGTGRSSGAFTAVFDTLAEDMAAAVDAVRARPEVEGIALGVMGESQGGWVAPLAASKRPVDFVVAAYGLAVSAVEEDRSEGQQSVARYGPEAQAQAEALHRAATRVAVSRFREGLDELERLKAAYGDAPWLKELGGDYTPPLVLTPAGEMDRIRALLNFPYDLEYEPEPVLAALKVPSLWVLAGQDTEAPHEGTLAVLRRLQASGAPIDVAVFPNADHGMIALEPSPEGPQPAGRRAPGYFDLLADWIATRRLAGPYGEARLIARR